MPAFICKTVLRIRVSGGNDKLDAHTKTFSRAGWHDDGGVGHAPGHVARCPSQVSHAAPGQFACAIRRPFAPASNHEAHRQTHNPSKPRRFTPLLSRRDAAVS